MKTFLVRREKRWPDGALSNYYSTMGFLLAPAHFERLTGQRLKIGERIRVRLVRVRKTP